jgi:hypothetical protein
LYGAFSEFREGRRGVFSINEPLKPGCKFRGAFKWYGSKKSKAAIFAAGIPYSDRLMFLRG